jgi:hypothetical protein
MRSVNDYLGDIDKQLCEERREKIRSMWMACYTQQEIAGTVGIDKATNNRVLEECCKTERLPKCNKLPAFSQDAAFRTINGRFRGSLRLLPGAAIGDPLLEWMPGSPHQTAKPHRPFPVGLNISSPGHAHRSLPVGNRCPVGK